MIDEILLTLISHISVSKIENRENSATPARTLEQHVTLQKDSYGGSSVSERTIVLKFYS